MHTGVSRHRVYDRHRLLCIVSMAILGGLIIGQDQDSVDGGYSAIQSWAGDVDNLRIYNRALNSTEIRALYEETGWGD